MDAALAAAQALAERLDGVFVRSRSLQEAAVPAGDVLFGILRKGLKALIDGDDRVVGLVRVADHHRLRAEPHRGEQAVEQHAALRFDTDHDNLWHSIRGTVMPAVGCRPHFRVSRRG